MGDRWGINLKIEKANNFLIALVYCILWCRGAESNHRHGDFQSPALPTELPRHEII